MAKQTINLGTTPSGVGGDTPRSAFTKAQANFDELYTALGGTTIPAALPVARGGTGVTTIASLKTALSLKTAAYADIVGTMAAGSVFEFGSNSNGGFIKYADGTIICFALGKPASAVIPANAQGDGTIKGIINLTLPAAFTNGNYSVMATLYPIGSWDYYGVLGTASSSGSTFGIFVRNGFYAQAFTFGFIAVGRWA